MADTISLADTSDGPPTPNERRILELETQLAASKRREKAFKAERDTLASSLTSGAKATIPKIPKSSGRKKRKDDWVRVILTDTHGSKVDPEAFAAVIADIARLAPDEIVHLGDSIDCGGFLAEHHTLGYVAEMDYSYADDVAAANDHFDRLQKAAPRAKFHLMEGNHERRVETYCVTKALRSKTDAEFLRSLISPQKLLRLEERGINYYRECEKHGESTVPGWLRLGKCWFVHGISTAKHAARAHLDKAGGNVVFGHTHRIDSAHDELPNVGPVAAWNPGCLSIKQPLWRHTSPTGWGHGFAVQIVARSGEFLHLNIPIIEGRSLLPCLLG